MNGRLDFISVEQMDRLVPDLPQDEREIMHRVALQCNPLLAGMYGPDLACIVGLVPTTLLSDTVYLWLYTTPFVDRHKTSFGRWAKRLVAAMKMAYPMVTGHCLAADERAQRWLGRLGAEFVFADTKLVQFVIRGN